MDDVKVRVSFDQASGGGSKSSYSEISVARTITRELLTTHVSDQKSTIWLRSDFIGYRR